MTQAQIEISSAFSPNICLSLGARDVTLDPQSRNIDTPAPRPQTPLRVLIVDDHPMNRLAFSLILESCGAQTSTAETGEMALDLLSAETFDLVLMDLNMPGMGGMAATRALRTSSWANRQVVVIALTASISTEEIDRGLAAGMDAFVPKPVGAYELLAAIDQTLSAVHGSGGEGGRFPLSGHALSGADLTEGVR